MKPLRQLLPKCINIPVPSAQQSICKVRRSPGAVGIMACGQGEAMPFEAPLTPAILPSAASAFVRPGARQPSLAAPADYGASVPAACFTPPQGHAAADAATPCGCRLMQQLQPPPSSAALRPPKPASHGHSRPLSNLSVSWVRHWAALPPAGAPGRCQGRPGARPPHSGERERHHPRHPPCFHGRRHWTLFHKLPRISPRCAWQLTPPPTGRFQAPDAEAAARTPQPATRRL